MATVRTIELKITKVSDKEKYEKYCSDYTAASKKCINQAELLADEEFMNHICSTYNIETLQAYRNLVNDVKAKLNSALECHKLNEKYLLELNELYEAETDLYLKYKIHKKIVKTKKRLHYETININGVPKQIPDPRISFGTKAKQAKLTKAQNKLNKLIDKKNNPEKYLKHKNKVENQTHTTYFDKKLNKKVKVKKKQETLTIDQQIEKQKKYVEKCKNDLKNSQKFIPILSEGEANQKGNRYAKFDNMTSEHKIVYCPTAKEHIDLYFICNKKTEELLYRLQTLALDCKIALTTRFSPDKIYISYDEEELNGYAFDKKSYDRERKEKISKETEIKCRKLTEEEITEIKKDLKKKYAIEREERLKEGKIVNRVAATDLNPGNVNLVIFDVLSNGEFKYIAGYHYDLSFYTECKWRYESPELNTHMNNKHINEIHLIYKDMFKRCNHYKCFIFAMEDLDLKIPKSVDKKYSTEFRRKVNNIWHRELHTYDIYKWCAIYGFKLVKVAPWHTSWIGNLKYEFVDPINAAIEIGRRGYYRYLPESQYPYPDMTDDDYSNLVDLFPEYFKNESVVRKSNLRRSWPYWYKTLINLFSSDVDFGHRWRAGFEQLPEGSYESARLNLYNSRVVLSTFICLY